MSILKKLVGETAIYGVSSVVGRMLNYLLVPLYTSVFAPAAYGVVTELYAYVAFLNILYIYGLETAYFRFAKEDEEKYFQLICTSVLISSTLLSGTIWLASDSIVQWMGFADIQIFIKWLAIILAIDALVAIPFARLRYHGKARRFAVFKLSNIGLNIFFNIFFILVCPYMLEQNPDHIVGLIYNPDLGIGYVFLSNLLANAAYLLFFIPTWRSLRLRLPLVDYRRVLHYAWPVLIIGFAGVTNEMFSRAILKYRLPSGYYENYTNLEILGIFGACYKLSVFMALAIQAFRYAFEPFFFAQASNKNSPAVFSQVMTYFVLFGSFSWLILSIFMPHYAPLFLRQDSYLVGLDAVPWLLGGGLFLGIFYNLSIWYKLTDHTLYGAYISLFGAVITFLLNWTLIPLYGYMGSAYATFGSYLAMTVISYAWGRRHYPVRYQLFKVLFYLFIAGFGIFIHTLFESTLLLSITITLIFLTLVLLVERKLIRLALHKI